MHNPSKTISLTRRVIDHFLMYGLGCLFLSVAMVLTLHWKGLLLTQLHLVVIIPAVCLCIGVIMFRSMFRVTGDIDSQIRNYANSTDSHHLNQIYRPDPLAVGWNAIVDRLTTSTSTESLESRICQSLGNIKSHKHQLVFDSYPEGLVMTDAEGAIVHVNRAFPVIFGLDEETDVTGMPIPEILKFDELENRDDILKKINQQIVSLNFEIKPTFRNNKQLTIRVARQKLTDTNGNEEGFLWSFRDVTQAKLAEEMRNQFVFTATHELRTPLSNIKAYAETLALDEQISVDDQKKFCNIINSEVTRLGRFVDELLNVSQMEAGSLSLTKQQTNLAKLFEEVIHHNQPQIEKKQIQFSTIIPPKLPELSIDKDKITASLVNLLGNAVKYTPDGGKVSFKVLLQEKTITVEIEDTGFGIAPDELPKIFEKFYRSDDKRVREISGSGLGLAFAKEAIRLHGGTLDAFSELNKGTKFVLSLPK